jgi:hypothetical protein
MIWNTDATKLSVDEIVERLIDEGQWLKPLLSSCEPITLSSPYR